MLFNLFAANNNPRSIREPVPVFLPCEFSDRCKVTSRRPGTSPADGAPPTAPAAPTAPTAPPTAPGQMSIMNPCHGVHEKLDAIQALLESVNDRLDKIEEDLHSEYETEDTESGAEDTESGTEDTDTGEDSGTDTGYSLDVGQLVRYKDGPKTRLGVIVAVDESEPPASFTIKFEDDPESPLRYTTADRLSPL